MDAGEGRGAAEAYRAGAGGDWRGIESVSPMRAEYSLCFLNSVRDQLWSHIRKIEAIQKQSFQTEVFQDGFGNCEVDATLSEDRCTISASESCWLCMEVAVARDIEDRSETRHRLIATTVRYWERKLRQDLKSRKGRPVLPNNWRTWSRKNSWYSDLIPHDISGSPNPGSPNTLVWNTSRYSMAKYFGTALYSAHMSSQGYYARACSSLSESSTISQVSYLSQQGSAVAIRYKR